MGSLPSFSKDCCHGGVVVVIVAEIVRLRRSPSLICVGRTQILEVSLWWAGSGDGHTEVELKTMREETTVMKITIGISFQLPSPDERILTAT